MLPMGYVGAFQGSDGGVEVAQVEVGVARGAARLGVAGAVAMGASYSAAAHRWSFLLRKAPPRSMGALTSLASCASASWQRAIISFQSRGRTLARSV